MTEIKNNAPQQDREKDPVTITLTTGKARKIDFKKPCLDKLIISRKVNNDEWQDIARDVRLPFIDDEAFEQPAYLEYLIKLEHPKGTLEEYYVKVSLH